MEQESHPIALEDTLVNSKSAAPGTSKHGFLGVRVTEDVVLSYASLVGTFCSLDMLQQLCASNQIGQ